MSSWINLLKYSLKVWGMQSLNRFPVVRNCHKITVELFICKGFLNSWVMHFGTQRENCLVLDCSIGTDLESNRNLI